MNGRGFLCATCVGLVVAGGGSCTPFDLDLGDALLAITPEGESEITLSHEPGRSEVRVTPPNGESFTATFSVFDPVVQVLITVRTDAVAEQEDVAFPLDGSAASIEIEHDQHAYAASSPEAEGFLTVERMVVDDSALSFRGSFQGTVVDDAGGKAAVSGFIDAQYAQLSLQ